MDSSRGDTPDMTDAPGLAGTVAILGGGKIGEALLSGLMRGGRRPAEVVVSDKDADRAAHLADTYGVPTRDVAAAVTMARIVVVAVKPQDVRGLLVELDALLTPDHLLVSVAAGITAATIEATLTAAVPVVRCMPNTPALVDEAMTAISAGSYATPEHLASAELLLSAVGRVVRVPEDQLDAVTALSGSGPAYFFYLVEAMIDAGVELGLPRALATELIVQTAVGSAVMLRDSGHSPGQLRAAVSSPAGTTVAAISELEKHGVRAALEAAMTAACRRSAELGAGG